MHTRDLDPKLNWEMGCVSDDGKSVITPHPTKLLFSLDLEITPF